MSTLEAPTYRCINCGETTHTPKELGCPNCHAEPGDLYDATLGVGSRVTVYRPRRKGTRPLPLVGTIIGQSRRKTCWRIQVDGRAYPISFRKTYVTAEEPKREEQAA